MRRGIKTSSSSMVVKKRSKFRGKLESSHELIDMKVVPVDDVEHVGVGDWPSTATRSPCSPFVVTVRVWDNPR